MTEYVWERVCTYVSAVRLWRLYYCLGTYLEPITFRDVSFSWSLSSSCAGSGSDVIPVDACVCSTAASANNRNICIFICGAECACCGMIGVAITFLRPLEWSEKVKLLFQWTFYVNVNDWMKVLAKCQFSFVCFFFTIIWRQTYTRANFFTHNFCEKKSINII